MPKTVTIKAQQKWDVACESRRTENSLTNTLNELGQQGWELVNVLHHKDPKGENTWTAFLKRPSVGQTISTTTSDQSSSALLAPTPSKQEEEKKPEFEGFDLSGDAFALKEE